MIASNLTAPGCGRDDFADAARAFGSRSSAMRRLRPRHPARPPTAPRASNFRNQSSSARPPGPTPGVRDRQGRRRKVDGGDRAGHVGGPARPAHDRGRAGQPGTRPAHVSSSRASGSRRSSWRRGCSRSRSTPSWRWRSTCASRPARSGQMLGSSRLFHAFAMATPGMRELLSMGKVWELAQLERRTSGAAAV